MTDHHDLHMEVALALQDSWVRAVTRKLLEKRNIKKEFNNKPEGLYSKLQSLLSRGLELAYQVAVFRIINASQDENWNFSSVKAARWIESNNQLEEYGRALRESSSKSNDEFVKFFVPFYDSILADLGSVKEYVVGDHDLIDVFNQLIYVELGQAPSIEGLLSSLYTAVDNNSSKIASLRLVMELNDRFISLKGHPLIPPSQTLSRVDERKA